MPIQNQKFILEDYYLKKYERKGMLISIALYLLMITFLFVDLKSFKKNNPETKQQIIQIKLVEKERVIVPEASKSEQNLNGIQKGLDTDDDEKMSKNTSNTAFIEDDKMIEAKDFYEGNTTLPFEKIDFEVIRKKVLAQLVYPALAKQNGWEETVQLALTINTSGELIGVRIDKPSKRRIFNDIVLLTMEKIKGDIFPKPSKTSTVLFDIEFSL